MRSVFLTPNIKKKQRHNTRKKNQNITITPINHAMMPISNTRRHLESHYGVGVKRGQDEEEKVGEGEESQAEGVSDRGERSGVVPSGDGGVTGVGVGDRGVSGGGRVVVEVLSVAQQLCSVEAVEGHQH